MIPAQHLITAFSNYVFYSAANPPMGKERFISASYCVRDAIVINWQKDFNILE